MKASWASHPPGRGSRAGGGGGGFCAGTHQTLRCCRTPMSCCRCCCCRCRCCPPARCCRRPAGQKGAREASRLNAGVGRQWPRVMAQCLISCRYLAGGPPGRQRAYRRDCSTQQLKSQEPAHRRRDTRPRRLALRHLAVVVRVVAVAVRGQLGAHSARRVAAPPAHIGGGQRQVRGGTTQQVWIKGEE